MKKRKFPCKCGHEAALHESVDPGIGEEWCNGEIEDSIYPFEGGIVGHEICSCAKYTPDNLKYLEQKYQERKNKQWNKQR